MNPFLAENYDLSLLVVPASDTRKKECVLVLQWVTSDDGEVIQGVLLQHDSFTLVLLVPSAKDEHLSWFDVDDSSAADRAWQLDLQTLPLSILISQIELLNRLHWIVPSIGMYILASNDVQLAIIARQSGTESGHVQIG